MRKLKCFLLSCLSVITISVFAQRSWTEIGSKENAPDVATEASYTRAANGDFIVVYEDRSSYGEQRPKVKRLTGKKWIDVGSDAIIPGRAVDMSVIEFNGKIFAAFRETPGDKSHVYSFDGSKWTEVGKLGYTTDHRLLTDGSKLYLACYTGEPVTRLTVYVLEGNSWKETGSGAPLEKDSNAPFDIQVHNGQLFIAYTNKPGIYEGKVKKLVADKWVNAGPLASDYTVKHIQLAFDGEVPHVALYSDKDYNVYIKKLVTIKDANNKEKLTWMPAAPGNGIAIKDLGRYLNYVITGGRSFIVYMQDRSEKLRGITLSGNGWTVAGSEEFLTEDTDAGLALRLIATPENLYALFRDPNNNGVAIKQLPVK
jgi:hypothetical protein